MMRLIDIKTYAGVLVGLGEDTEEPHQPGLVTFTHQPPYTPEARQQIAADMIRRWAEWGGLTRPPVPNVDPCGGLDAAGQRCQYVLGHHGACEHR